MAAADVSAVLDGVEPPFGGYRRTRAALVRYTEMARGRRRGTATRPGEGHQTR